MERMLDAMIRYDAVNTSDANLGDLEDVAPAQLLKIFKSVGDNNF